MMTTDNSASLGQRLRKARECAGLSIRTLSTKVGVDPGYITRLESGQRKHPAVELLLKIAVATNTDSRELLEPLGIEPTSILPSTRDFFRQKYGISTDDADILTNVVEYMEHQLHKRREGRT
jgi:transcriptional regulator with XRE-family HTH domain